MLNKRVNGFVSQLYDTDTGKFISQEFVASDEVEWEFQSGMPVTDSLVKSEGLNRAYCPMEMVKLDYIEEVEGA